MAIEVGTAGDIIRKYCVPDEPHDTALQIIVDGMSENFDYEDASQILIATFEEMAQQNAEFEGWSKYDKLTWLVRKAFLLGFSYATDLMLTQNEMAADDAEKEIDTHG